MGNLIGIKKPPPPLIKIPVDKKDWASPGVAEKPSGCNACTYALIGAGFCGDDNPEGKKMLLLCAAATKGEILEQRAWSGAQGWAYTRMFLDSADIPRNEVMVSHVLRCRPPFRRTGSGTDSYPTGTQRRNAELTCRQFDDSHTYHGEINVGGIKSFAPDTFLVTFEPEKALEVTAYKRIIQEDIKKAWRLVQKGRRVCVLMGEPPFSLLGDGLVEEGGVKNWRGHYWSAEWPYDTMVSIAPTFAAPKPQRWRSRK
jgi:hypothetical protein